MHGAKSHPIDEPCDFCDQVKKEFNETYKNADKDPEIAYELGRRDERRIVLEEVREKINKLKVEEWEKLIEKLDILIGSILKPSSPQYKQWLLQSEKVAEIFKEALAQERHQVLQEAKEKIVKASNLYFQNHKELIYTPYNQAIGNVITLLERIEGGKNA